MTEVKTTEAKTTKKGKVAVVTEDVVLGEFTPAASFASIGEDSDLPGEALRSITAHVHSASGELPKFATSGSACFDICAYFGDHSVAQCYGFNNNKNPLKVRTDTNGVKYIMLDRGDRVLVPTGLFFDLPDYTVLELFSRSGLSWKSGLILTNGVANIDSDYVDEVFVSLTNISGAAVWIKEGERIAQGRISDVAQTTFKSIRKPKPKTDREGGFGSTGV